MLAGNHESVGSILSYDELLSRVRGPHRIASQ